MYALSIGKYDQSQLVIDDINLLFMRVTCPKGNTKMRFDLETKMCFHISFNLT